MKYLPLLVLLFFLGSCGFSVNSFEGTVYNTKTNVIEVDCTDAVNRNKSGSIDAIAYQCSVNVTEDTVITDKNDKQITIDELKEGQKVEVRLNKNKAINKSVNSREVTAKEIHILN